MTPSRLYLSLTISTLCLLNTNAFAAPILEKGDWTYSEVNTSSGTQCVASNKDSSWFRSEVYFLEISKLKNKPNSPAEISIRVENNKRGNLGFVANIKGASSQFVFTPHVGNQKQQIFLGLGSNLSQFIELLKSNKEDIVIQGLGGSSTSDFSNDGDGFKEIAAEIEKRCNNNTKLADAKFENYFFYSLPKNLNPLKINTSTTSQLRNFYFSAFDLFMQGKEAQSALDAVIAKYLPAMRELETVKKNIDQIQNIDLPNARQILADAQKQQVEAQAEITRLTALIPTLQNEVAISQRAFDEASAILAPHVPEYNRITNRLSNANTALNDAKNRYSYITSRLEHLSSQISSLDSEADQLSFSLSRQRSDLNDLRSNLRDAERRRSQYNVSYERDRRIRSDSEHSRMQDERQRLNSNLTDAERDLNQIRGEKERIKKSLEQCKNTVPPPIDCSSLERALEVAAAQLSEKERAKSEISSRLNTLISRIAEIEDAIDRRIRGEYETLVRREEEIRNEHDRAEDLVRRNESRLSDIRGSLIPQMEREQSQLISEKPQVSAQIRDYSNAVDQAATELENFKRATDWERKADNVDKTKSKLITDQNSLSRAQSGKLAAEKSLDNGRAIERQSNEKISQLINRTAELNKRSNQLEEAIKPLAHERAPLDQRIAQLRDALGEVRENFTDLIKAKN